MKRGISSNWSRCILHLVITNQNWRGCKLWIIAEINGGHCGTEINIFTFILDFENLFARSCNTDHTLHAISMKWIYKRTCNIKKDLFLQELWFYFSFTKVISFIFWLCVQNCQFSAKVANFILFKCFIDGLILGWKPFYIRSWTKRSYK